MSVDDVRQGEDLAVDARNSSSIVEHLVALGVEARLGFVAQEIAGRVKEADVVSEVRTTKVLVVRELKRARQLEAVAKLRVAHDLALIDFGVQGASHDIRVGIAHAAPEQGVGDDGALAVLAFPIEFIVGKVLLEGEPSSDVEIAVEDGVFLPISGIRRLGEESVGTTLLVGNDDVCDRDGELVGGIDNPLLLEHSPEGKVRMSRQRQVTGERGNAHDHRDEKSEQRENTHCFGPPLGLSP